MASANDEFVLCLNNNVYISTITDLNKDDMLKMDVKPGRYKLIPFYEGYIFAEENYVPRLKDIVKIFWTRVDDKGLSGTYWGGKSEDVHVLRLFNSIRRELHPEFVKGQWSNFLSNSDLEDGYYDDYEYSDEEGNIVQLEMKKKEYLDNLFFNASWDSEKREYIKKPVPDIDVKTIPDYHNIPLIFFLMKPPENLSAVELEMSGNLNDDIKVWKVKDGEEFTGYAVHSKELICMLGDQAGIAVFSGALAFGNFEAYQHNDPDFKEIDESDLFSNPDRKYVCDFKPCHCSVNYYDYDKEKRQKAIEERTKEYNSKMENNRATKEDSDSEDDKWYRYYNRNNYWHGWKW